MNSPSISRPGLLTRAGRRLLELDRPTPPATDEQLAAEVEHHYPWNFWVNLLDGVSFWFGASFATSSTILPLFISKLTPSPLPLGLLAVIAQSGWFLPQLFTAGWVERLARKKPIVINLGFFLERLPMWGLPFAALLSLQSPAAAVALLLIFFAWHCIGAGVVATAWQELLARCFPVDRRGRFFGLTMFLGTGTGALGALGCTWILQNYPFPTNFTVAFGICAAFITLSWAFLALTREPVQPVKGSAQSQQEYLSGLMDILRHDHNFRRFLITRLLTTLGNMGTGFIAVSAVQRWHVADGTVGLYTTAMLAGQTAGNLAFGFLADRFGHKLSLELGSLASAVGFAVIWLTPVPVWSFATFAMVGVASGAGIVSGMLVVMEFCEPQRRPTYAGLTNTAVGLVGALAPLIGAALSTQNYAWLFGPCTACHLIALLLMRFWVREPRVARTIS